MNFSLRNRIAFFYLITTAVLVGLLFALIFSVVHNTVYNHLDGDLDAEASEVFKSIVVLNDSFIFANPFEWGEKEHNQVEVNPTFVQVVSKDGKIIKKSGNLFVHKLEFNPNVKTKKYFDTNLLGSPTRQLQMPILNPNGNVLGYLIIAIPLEESALVLADLRNVLIISFPIVLLILFFTTRYIAGKSISPIKKVISVTEKITRENLNERIELPVHKDEIYNLASKINDLLNRLEDAVIREKQFTSDASHQLRTPLTVLKGTLGVLIRKPREIPYYEEKIKESIKEVDRISHLVDQLLLLARHESGKIEPVISRFNLREKVLSNIERLFEQMKNKNIGFDISEKNIYVSADSELTDIILENILSNSIKYSHQDCKININLVETNGTVDCIIQDNGIGMTDEQVEKIFDRFYRTDESREAQIEGSGLGLAIVKKLSEIQQIKINIESKKDSGTSFHLIFNS